MVNLIRCFTIHAIRLIVLQRCDKYSNFKCKLGNVCSLNTIQNWIIFSIPVLLLNVFEVV